MTIAKNVLIDDWFINFCDIISNKAHYLKANRVSLSYYCKLFTIMVTNKVNEFNIYSLVSYCNKYRLTNLLPYKREAVIA